MGLDTVRFLFWLSLSAACIMLAAAGLEGERYPLLTSILLGVAGGVAGWRALKNLPD